MLIKVVSPVSLLKLSIHPSFSFLHFHRESEYGALALALRGASDITIVVLDNVLTDC